MERFYTTVKQAKKLMELGIDPKTCDMTYTQIAHREGEEVVQEFEASLGQDIAISHDLFSFRNGYTIPCWSLVALLNLIPDFEVITHTVNGVGGSYRECFIDSGFHQTDFRTSLIDGAFDMVVYLLEFEKQYGTRKEGNLISTRDINEK